MIQQLDRLIDIYTLIWLFPLAFIIHDLEEIITAGSFMRKNSEKVKLLLPKRLKGLFEKVFSITSAQFGVAVGFISIFIFLATYLGSLTLENSGSIVFFTAAIIVFFTHVFTHVGQALVMRNYTPGVITAVIIALPYSLYVFYRLFNDKIINWSTVYASVPYSLLIIPIVLIAHVLARKIINSQYKL